VNRLILTTVLLIANFLVLAQGDHADCSSAIILQGNTYSVSSINGPGNELEIFGHELGNEMYFTEEHNTVWFAFSFPYDGELTFTITPNNPKDDWDFMLFRAEISQCGAIAGKEIKPLRSNLARNNNENGGVTGLNITAMNEFSAAGLNSNMSKLIEVLENESFLLVVDIKEYGGDGFKLDLHFKKFEKEIHIEEEHIDGDGFAFIDMTEAEDEKNLIQINFKVLTEGSNEPVNCQAEIIGVQWSDTTLKYDDRNNFSAGIPRDKWFFVNVKKEGYTFGTEKFKATEEMEGRTKTIYISRVAKGNNIVLREIVFSPNTTHMLPASVNALEQLINFMNEYPTAEILVKGHVNAPGYDNEGKVKKFSLKRAEQIKEYMTDAGIAGRRIDVAGMGNEFMLYPNPSNYQEEKANRRVEIEILSY